jgi:hypothetical protein
MFALGVPLLIIPFAIYNILAFLLPGFSWTTPLLTLHMSSGGELTVTPGDLIVVASILVLLIESIKATRMSRRSVIDHLLSTLLFVGMLVEFLLVKEAASTTFFLMLVTAFVDVIGGFAIATRAAQRDISVTDVESVHGH